MVIDQSTFHREEHRMTTSRQLDCILAPANKFPSHLCVFNEPTRDLKNEFTIYFFKYISAVHFLFKGNAETLLTFAIFIYYKFKELKRFSKTYVGIQKICKHLL